MGATFSRVKTWIAEVLSPADLNAEFDNILTNLTPTGVDDHSSTVGQMQTIADPGEVGTESQATSLAGEIERIRNMLKEISGKTQWYESPATSLEELNALGENTGNRIVSGLSRSGSSQLIALDPDGTAATVVLRGASTNFLYRINGTQYTVSTDVSLTSIQTAPTSNNTALVDDSDLAGADSTKVIGENGTTLTIGTVGSEISSLVGERAAFKIVGGGTEYFTALVASSTTLTKIQRGYFFDDLNSPIPRTTITDGDTITLMKITWIYVNTTGVLNASHVEPIVAVTQPTPVIGQYWFDLVNDTWKLGDGATFTASNSIPIGYCFQDGTGTLGARNFDVFRNSIQQQSIILEHISNTVIRSTEYAAKIGVFGSLVTFTDDTVEWDILTDLDSGVSEASSTQYYAYLDEQGKTILSDVAPYDRTKDLLGFYHPHQLWRCIGQVTNDGSSNFTAASLKDYGQTKATALTSDSIDTLQLKDASVTTVKLDAPIAMKRTVFTAGGTYTTSSSTTSLLVEVIGSGGGGGGGGGGNAGGGGGGGGGGSSAAHVIKVIPVSISTGYTITIAAAANAGSSGTADNNGTSGGNGTSSSFDTLAIALGGNGGGGGQGATAGGAAGALGDGSSPSMAAGGIGGTPTNSGAKGGDANSYAGIAGGSSAGNGGGGGGGGSSIHGIAGASGVGGASGSIGTNAATTNGSNYGVGGSAGGGGGGSSSGFTGGNGTFGAQGLVIVYEVDYA